MLALWAAFVPWSQEKASSAKELAHGQTVIMGTWSWDIEIDRQNNFNASGPDVWLEQRRVGPHLVPMGKAALAPITTAKAFAQLAHDEVADAKYSREAVEGTFLKVGAIVGLKTNEGNYAKLTVIGYRDSHDFSFESAKLIPADRRAVTVSRPNIPNYHLELRWVLWEK